ncbi:Lactose permease [Colletotrichum sp. SAR11_59]|nr:Lactose permease [Colletotrichum sp. SAR11_59]
MGVFGKKKDTELAVGSALAAVLPANPKPWYRTSHLLKLNLCLLVPLFSSASVGYDGSMMNGLQTLPQWRGFFGNPEGAVLGLMNAVYPLGKVVALFFVTYISDRWGRAIPVIQLLGLFFLPESPRWLMSRGRKDEARKVFADYHAGGDLNNPLVEFEMREVEQTLNAEAEAMSQSSWMELVRTPANRKRTLLAVIVGFFSQWNGVAVVSYYLTLVLNTIGITEVKDQTLINGLLQIFNWIISTFLGALMVDRLGRRPLFLISTGGMLASYIIWTGLTSYFVTSKNEATGRAVVGFIFIFYFFYDIAWTPLLQAYPVEIFPYTLRGRGLSVTYITAFTGLIIGNQVNPIAMKSIAWKYYIVFCCILGLLLGLICILFPETKAHTLEEIREVFEGKPEGKEKDIEGADVDEVTKEGRVKQVELA